MLTKAGHLGVSNHLGHSAESGSAGSTCYVHRPTPLSGGPPPRIRSCHPSPRSASTPSCNQQLIQRGSHAGLPLLKRKRTDRTKWIAFEQVQEAVNAYAFARWVSLPLNAHLTVVWEATPLFKGRSGADIWSAWSSMQTDLVDDMTRQLDRWGSRTASVWTRERANRRGRLHTHFSLHLGDGSRSSWLPGALKNYLDRKFRFDDTGIRIDPLRTEFDRTRVMRYIYKGLDRTVERYDGREPVEIARELNIPDRGSQGEIRIKRAGVSQNVAKVARCRHGWSEIRNLDRMHSILNPVEF